LEETIESIKRAVKGKNFRLIRIQTFDDGYVDKDKQDPKKTIIYFCNFQFLNHALGIDPRVGMFLPCRITVVEQQGKVQVMAINPLRLSKLFNNNELNKACEEMRDLYIEILEEATL
jgi:cytochrome c oxidase cbb3-type subunit 3